MNYVWATFLTLALFLSPVAAYVAGFYAGAIRLVPLRLVVAPIVVILPLAALLSPLVIPDSSESSRFAAGMGLVVLGAPLAFWMLLATIGAFKGAAWRRARDS